MIWFDSVWVWFKFMIRIGFMTYQQNEIVLSK